MRVGGNRYGFGRVGEGVSVFAERAHLLRGDGFGGEVPLRNIERHLDADEFVEQAHVLDHLRVTQPSTRTRMSVVKLKENCDTSTFSFSFFDLPFIGLKPSAVKGKVPPMVRYPTRPESISLYR